MRTVPGSLKNALDWLVASVEFPNKAVALLNTSPRSTHALSQLTEILTTMSARLIPEASPTFALPVPLPASVVLASDPEFSKTLGAALSAFVRAIRLNRNLVRGVSQAMERK
jgi:chromate reductase